MAQRSEDGVGKTSEMSRRFERAISVWTRSAISIQASSRDHGCVNRPDTRKHLNLSEQISLITPCIRRGVHTRTSGQCTIGSKAVRELGHSAFRVSGYANYVIAQIRLSPTSAFHPKSRRSVPRNG